MRLPALMASTICVACSLPVALAAQQATGRVVTPDGFGIAGVEVQVLPAGAKATTDSAGRFVFWPIAAGTYAVRARRLGFTPATATLRVGKGASPVVIVLQAAAALLDTVRSQALQFELPRIFQRQATGVGSLELGPDLMAKFPSGFSFTEMMQFDFALSRRLHASSRCPERMLVNDRPVERWQLDVIKPQDVAAVEAFNSMDGVHEPGVDAHRGDPAWPECTHLLLVWLKGYEQERWAGH